MNFGFIYRYSWFGEANEDNNSGWGLIYPLLAGGSFILTSITSIFTDTLRITTDKIKF
jgi:hypothetical protein